MMQRRFSSTTRKNGLALLGRRWAPEVLLALGEGPSRFNTLLQIKGISDRVLTERLRELEQDGLVVRRVTVGRPVTVTYQLTASAHPLLPPLRELGML